MTRYQLLCDELGYDEVSVIVYMSQDVTRNQLLCDELGYDQISVIV